MLQQDKVNGKKIFTIPPEDVFENGINEEKVYSLSEFEHLRITEATEIPEPNIFLKINGEEVSPQEDITCVSGAQKTGKSAFTQPVIAAAITKDGIILDQFEGLEIAINIKQHAVIHIDTEQARHKHQRNLRGILKRAMLTACPAHFLSYNIRKLDLEEYRSTTTGIFAAALKDFGGIHVAVIDGIADYIADTNEQKDSNAIVKYFEQLAIDYKVPIIVIVHTNPGNDKERGHTGSQLLRKAGSVLGIKQEGDVSYLEPKYLRYAGKGNIPFIQFMYDKEKGYHVSCGNRNNEAKKQGHIAKTEAVTNTVFAPPKSLLYGEALAGIMKNCDIKERQAKDYFKEMGLLNLITQGEDKRWRKSA